MPNDHDATRRPQSRFAAGAVEISAMPITMVDEPQAGDDMLNTAVMIARAIRDAEICAGCGDSLQNHNSVNLQCADGHGTFVAASSVEKIDARSALQRAGLHDDFEAQTYHPLPAGCKPTNPKDMIGSGKLPLHLWPTTATAMGSIGLLEGMVKYGRQNWRASGVRASIYVDACKRHLDAWFEGEDVAPDSGVPHLSNALACLAILVDAKAAGKLTDDRSYNGEGYRKLVEELTPQVERLKALHKGKDPKHYTIAEPRT